MRKKNFLIEIPSSRGVIARLTCSRSNLKGIANLGLLRAFQALAMTAIFTLLSTSSAHAKKITGDNISNMIIEGENRLQVFPVIPGFDWNPDVYRDVSNFLLNNLVIKTMQPPAIEKPGVFLTDKLDSDKGAKPWTYQIYEQPVLTLKFKKPLGDKKSESVFFVKDSNGRNFYEMRKRGNLPGEIMWDGLGDNGEPLQVGYDYTYSFSAVDEAGNPQRVAGKPFRIDAFRYRRNGVISAFYPEAIFDDRASYRFSRDGLMYLTEVKDYLRANYGRRVDVIVYDNDAKFGMARAQTVAEYLTNALNLPEDRVVPQVQNQQNGGGYRHVDIVAK